MNSSLIHRFEFEQKHQIHCTWSFPVILQRTRLSVVKLKYPFAAVTYLFGFSSYRGSPIGFSGSGIWLISRPGFGILKEKEDEIRDCNYDRDTGFGDFNRRESGNVALKKARFVNSRD